MAAEFFALVTSTKPHVKEVLQRVRIPGVKPDQDSYIWADYTYSKVAPFYLDEGSETQQGPFFYRGQRTKDIQ